MVRAAVACKIKMHEYLLGELIAQTSPNEVFLHSLCLYVSHEDQLLFTIEGHSQSLRVLIIVDYDALVPQLLPGCSTNIGIV